jgi:acetylornithine deacetylase/succinyl-diaminopimelate desuccinylase family protein
MNVTELTQELVRINSENPPGNEKAIAGFVKDFLEDAGIQAELIGSGGNRFNVAASIGNGEGGLMFNGHLDTVPIGEGWTKEPLGGELADGKVYGRGAFDMKGGIACMLMTAQRFAKEELKSRLLFTFVADEEAGGRFGSAYLIKERKDLFEGIKMGVIAEPTGVDRVRVAQKGIADIRVTFTGKAAHGSRPGLGDNAIMKAVEFINEVKQLSNQLASTKHEMLGPGTINVGKIVGGVKVNVVPDRCMVDIDRRIIPGETPETAVKQFQEILDRLKLEAKIEALAARNPMILPKDSPLLKEILAVLPSAELVGMSGYTEMEMYSRELGMDCVTWGTGSKEGMDMAHVADEYVDVEELEKTVTLYEKLVRRLCL